ncbi:MAG: hypothetical protein ACRDYX_17915 [Egibacteraceae bacterium]
MSKVTARMLSALTLVATRLYRGPKCRPIQDRLGGQPEMTEQ